MNHKLSTMRAVVLAGRILFSIMFIMTITLHFSKKGVDYAAMHGVPVPDFLVPAAGVLAILGGLSVLFGFHARIGAWFLVAFLVPVTLWMHAFWNESDPMQQQMQMTNFMKNITMLGGALLITYFGAGPISFDERRNLPALRHEQELSRVLDNNRGIRVEDTKEEIKMDAFSELPDDLSLQHFWQNADDPAEVVLQFRSPLERAKELIKRKTPKQSKQELPLLKESFA